MKRQEKGSAKNMSVIVDKIVDIAKIREFSHSKNNPFASTIDKNLIVDKCSEKQKTVKNDRFRP